MNQAPLAVYKSQAFKAKIMVLNGPLEGRSFKLISNQILIGRSPAENDIVLEYDKFCSRKHALIIVSGNTYTVQKISKKTPLFVNKKEIQDKKILKNKDILTVGQTQLKLHILKQSELAVVPPSSMLKTPPPAGKPQKMKNPLPLPRLILLLVIGAGAYLFLSDTSTESNKIKKNQIQLRTKQNFEDDLLSVQEMEKNKQEERKKMSNQSYKNAQIAYLKGIRDYRQGLFGRARENFRVCRTLYPGHKLCSGYLKKSQMKYEQLAQRNLILGKSYMDKKQYKQCFSAFKTVLNMMSYNKQHKLFKEAGAHFKYCKLNIKDRY